MRKNRWRESIKSFFGSHIDPEKDEELNGTKTEIEDKIQKIMSLIKGDEDEKDANTVGNSKKESLVELMEDFHKHYQLLCARYDHLTGELREKVHGKQEKDLKSKLKLEHKNLCTQKRELEEQIEGQAMEDKHLGEENLGLRAHILELGRTSKEKEDSLSAVLRKLEENESSSMSKIEDLMAQANNLQLEVNTLRTQKGELERQVVFKSNDATTQVKGVIDQVNVLQEELNSLSSQNSESESCLKKVTEEISDFLTQIENLKEKLESKTVDLQRMLEENKGLERQVEVLEMEVASVCSQKSELEEQMRNKNHEADQLTGEKERLHVRISQSEKSVVERGDELSALQMKFEGLENDSSTQIKALGAEVNNLQQELDSLQTEKCLLELQTKKEKQNSLESLTWKEKQNIELTSKIAEHQATVKSQEDVINKLNEKHECVQSRYQESMLNLQTSERKIEETGEEFCKKFEDSLHMLSQRIRVAEQLHVENKDLYRKTKEIYEQEHKDLKERIASTEVTVKRMKDISLTANDMLTSLDTEALKFEECTGNFLNRISKASCEVLFAKDWVRRKNNKIKHVQDDVNCLLVQLGSKEAEILGFGEKVWKLENKVRELEKMVKEKEQGMLGLGEEKREAIRQLCVWIEYHRSRSDRLNKILSDMTAARKPEGTIGHSCSSFVPFLTNFRDES